ncbi:transposable element Tcb2 transposase [Trichonephila clavipes]|nr:transposable element Tcb2 transposase [Trichonephila clavipes]
MWNVTDWQKVVFSDESRFVLGTDDNRVRVWRCPGPFLNGFPGAIFQQDNARPHTARVAQDFLRHFQILPWPARSPDLSPVEHVWDQLKRQMPSCHSAHDLELAVRRFVGPSASGQHKVSNQLNAGPCGGIDEEHFWLNGYVNKQNCRIWSEANPQVYVETPLHPEKLTVWCALWAGGILLQKR